MTNYNDLHPNILSEDINQLKYIARLGNLKDLAYLSKHKEGDVRVHVVRNANKEIINTMVNDSYLKVIQEIAIKGYKDHLDVIIKKYHDEYIIMKEILSHKHEDHLEFAINIKNLSIRTIIVNLNIPKYQKIILEENGDDYIISETILRTSNDSNTDLLKAFLKNPYQSIRISLAKKNNMEILRNLLNDADEHVVSQAEETILSMNLNLI